ncbi:hypothetical protein EV700_0493 [Fluviicoccus keumensis]|uniref:Virulence factor lipase-like protein n=1 Tax=Fluviicoccus keumensis TaxID=1435465 RepID=A0A4Q7ZAE2_9GAMM|nr:hypothetical protein [Fluviicoccus keumensis]RZU47530.1 hypothetical protein EV700_0493 [Fluviicoccus keumensis]
MMRTTRLSAAVLSVALLLTGCFEDKESQSGSVDVMAGFDPLPLGTNPTVIPFPFDGLFAGAATPTLNIPGAATNPLVAQINQLDGFSTTASGFIDVFGFLDMDTVAANLVIVNLSTGVILKAGEDFTVQSATVPDKTGEEINRQRTRILIEPLKPLAPSTTYLVGLKKGVRTRDGGMLYPSPMFKILSSSTKVADQTDPLLAQYTDPVKLAQLEGLRSQIIQPSVALLATFGHVAADDLVLAYRFTTESTTKSLDRLAATASAQLIAAMPTGMTTHDVQAALPATADIYAGYTKVPFYLKTAGGDTHSTLPLTSFWAADATQPDVAAKHLSLIPCGAYAAGANIGGGVIGAPSASTTACFPVPVKQSDETIPMLVTVPNAASLHTKPAGGWPVVIFQHGITRNRTDLLAVAPALAAAGMVGVSIDLPLHGVAATGAESAFRIPGVGERTFDLDLVNNTTGAPGPDGLADGSGTHFINLSSPITSRDNLRQGAADLLTLRKSLANLDLDGDNVPDIDMSQVRFAAISLGGIVGGVFLGADKGASQTVGAAALYVPGGAIAKLLDGSRSYGPIISRGLGAAGVKEGTDDYETFMRLAQTLVDSGDPVNYAAAASAAHPTLLTEVLGDTVVPNSVMVGPAGAAQDLVAQSSFMAGTDPYGRTLGLTPDATKLNGTPTPRAILNAGGLHTWLQFSVGKHGSLLDPTHPDPAASAADKAAFQAVTLEMQREMVSFLKSNGTCLLIGDGSTCAAP